MGNFLGHKRETNPSKTYERIVSLLRENEFDASTQGSIGMALNVDQSTVSKWKNGKLPGIEVLIKVANQFNVSLDWLVFGEDYATQKESATPLEEGSTNSLKNIEKSSSEVEGEIKKTDVAAASSDSGNGEPLPPYPYIPLPPDATPDEVWDNPLTEEELLDLLAKQDDGGFPNNPFEVFHYDEPMPFPPTLYKYVQLQAWIDIPLVVELHNQIYSLWKKRFEIEEYRYGDDKRMCLLNWTKIYYHALHILFKIIHGNLNAPLRFQDTRDRYYPEIVAMSKHDPFSYSEGKKHLANCPIKDDPLINDSPDKYRF